MRVGTADSRTSVADTVPGGGLLAVGLGCLMFRTWGLSSGSIALSVVLTGAWNAFLRLGLPILAVAILAVTGRNNPALLMPALIGVAALAAAVGLAWLLMCRSVLARRVGETTGRLVSSLRGLLHKPPVSGWGDAVVRFRGQSTDLVGRRWQALTGVQIPLGGITYLVWQRRTSWRCPVRRSQA